LANQLLTISMITREALMILENNIVFSKFIRRDFDDKYGIAGAKIGTVLNIRKPPRYVGRTGQGLQIEDATETSVPLALTTQRGVDIAFTSQDLALSIDDFSERFIKPAIANVANFIDYDGMGLYSGVYNVIGTPGTVPNALLTYLQAGQRLDEEATPRDNERALIISPAMQAVIVDALKGLFQSSTDIARQYEEGTMGQVIGFKWSMDQNVRTQTIGALGGVPLVKGANQTGASLITDGWTAAAATRLNVGDVFTIDDVYAVNPQSHQSTGALRQFVATAPGVSDGAGNMTISIAPAITVTGPFQTVNSLPADNAGLNIYGIAGKVSPQGMAFHKEAFAMGCADLPLPGGVDMAARVNDKKLGMSLRLVRAYDINTDRFPCRLDVLYGHAALYPELACRVAS
jgi:P22 coat protein - gene protein 5